MINTQNQQPRQHAGQPGPDAKLPIHEKLGRARLTLGLAVLLLGLLAVVVLAPTRTSWASAAPSAPPKLVAPDAAGSDAGEWVLTTVHYENRYWSNFWSWTMDDFGTIPPGGSAVSSSHRWALLDDSKSWEGTATTALDLPLTIPGDGEADVSAQGNAAWRISGLSERDGSWSGGLFARVYSPGSGNAPITGCDPDRSEVSAEEMQNRTTGMTTDRARCTLKPALVGAGLDRFSVALLVETNAYGLRAGQDEYRVQIWVLATYVYCANQANCASIEGRVYTTGDADGGLPLIGVPVTLLRNGEFLKQTVTHPPFGAYRLPNVPITDSLTLSVTLRHDAVFPSTFQVRFQGQTGPVVQVWTQPFRTDAASNPLSRNIIFTDKPGFNRPRINTQPAISHAQLDDLATIYYHTRQAWQLAKGVGQPLDDLLPVDVVAFATQGGVFRRGASTITGPGTVSYINIDAAGSSVTDLNRPDNREWHEFGHQVMADAFGNLMPSSPGDLNHGGAANNGFVNPSTTDSWVEGFAEFYSLVVARDIASDPRPELYVGDNLEGNYLAWTDEEYALAGLLWDLIDPVDAGDASVLGGATYADCLDISFTNRLWWILSTDWGDAVPKSANLTRPGYGYIFDVKQFYDILKLQGVGAGHSHGGVLSDLDELFVAHGFFADLGLVTRVYEPGEEIGRAADVARPDRRARPPVTGSYIAYDARDASNGSPIDVRDFVIEVAFAPPFAHYGYRVRATSEAPGRLYYHGPDPQYQATTTITAWDPATGAVSTAPLVLTNDSYWQRLAEHPTDYFLQHTFEMEKGPRSFLPLVNSDGHAQPAAIAAMPRAQGPARVPKPCVPGSATPTPTPTATPTRDPGAPLVQAVTPNAAPAGVDTLVTISGLNFQPGANPFIGTAPLQAVSQPDTETLRGTLPAGLAPGVYAVIVVNPNGKTGTLPSGFTITQAAATPTSSPSGTPTRTPTPTSTPTPTASTTPGGAEITVGRILTADPDGDIRMAFLPGDVIRLRIEIINNGGAPVEVETNWEVRDPRGDLVPGFSGTGTATVDPQAHWWEFATLIPDGLPIGPYTFTGTVDFQGNSQSGAAVFYLAREMTMSDDFETPGAWPTDDNSSRTLAYIAGEYQMLLKNPNWWLWASPGLETTDIVLEADARAATAETGAYGFVFGISADNQDLYLFQLTNSGLFRLSRRADGSWTPLQDWAASAAIDVDQASNHLMVVVRGSGIALFANGIELAAFTGVASAQGKVGLSVSSLGENGFDARFDNFRAYSLVPAARTAQGRGAMDAGLAPPQPRQGTDAVPARGAPEDIAR